MNSSLPFLPGYSFKDLTKTHFGYPSSFEYSKGVPIYKTSLVPSAKTASDILKAENGLLDKDKWTELIYGPKRSQSSQVKLPQYLALDKKVLRFTGYFREDISDWANESYRIRRVKVLYYLQDDTIEIIEPPERNSGYLQGKLVKRQLLPQPDGKRNYLWKDLNIGVELFVYGRVIRLTDCDPWTREYLTFAGIEVGDPEAIPPDPYQEQKKNRYLKQNEASSKSNKENNKFYTHDRKVLRFYGTWMDDISVPPDVRKVILQYYLADDTLELLETQAPNSGRLPSKTVVRRQKIPKGKNKMQETEFFEPTDFRTDKEVIIFGKKVFLYDCDDFTRHYYRTNYGIEDMMRIEVMQRPKPILERVIPPHNGIGDWEDSLQNCLHLRPKPHRKDYKKEYHFSGVCLRFRAELVSTYSEDKSRRFVMTFYPQDDTVAIAEQSIPNSGYPGGVFLKRSRIKKSDPRDGGRPDYYSAADFYIGAEIWAAGKLFQLVDADRFVLTFMEEHPEIYTEEQIKVHRQNTTEEKLKSANLKKEKNEIIDDSRTDVVQNWGVLPYPIPQCLVTVCDLQPKMKIEEELYSANLPVSATNWKKAVNLCTDQNDITDMEELRKILLPALGHKLET